jgi:2-oxoisovalerate dehydrogenase E1 component
VDGGFDGRMARVASKDSIVPLGDAAQLVLVSEDEIEAAALSLARAVDGPTTSGTRRGTW